MRALRIGHVLNTRPNAGEETNRAKREKRQAINARAAGVASRCSKRPKRQTQAVADYEDAARFEQPANRSRAAAPARRSPSAASVARQARQACGLTLCTTACPCEDRSHDHPPRAQVGTFLQARLRDGNLQFLVTWKGFDHDQTSWCAVFPPSALSPSGARFAPNPPSNCRQDISAFAPPRAGLLRRYLNGDSRMERVTNARAHIDRIGGTELMARLPYLPAISGPKALCAAQPHILYPFL